MRARVCTDIDGSEVVVYENNERRRLTDCDKPGIPKGAVNKSNSGKIKVADFTTFNSYFFDRKHGNMRKKINDYLNYALAYGELDRLTGREIITERITTQCYTLENLRFWGIDRSRFYTDMEVKFSLDTPEHIYYWKGMLRCFCEFDADFKCEIMGIDKEFDHKGLTRLSSYLVPVYRNYEVDCAAERIWEWFGMKEALTNPKARDAKELAWRMGLKIEYLPVYDHDGIDSMVFFSDDELIVGQDFVVEDENGKNVRCKDQKPHKVKIHADTIVVNTNCIKREYSDFNIFHECIHYTKHYLAMHLQELACNDTRKMKMKELTPEEAENYQDPLFFMENQANRGAFGLMMPISDMQERIYAEMRNVRCYRHKGELYDIVGRKLYKTLELPEFRIRARMIQLGHIEAVGAMNYVDHRRVRPFAFDKENFLVEKHVFIINEYTLKKLCDTNGKLRELIDSRKYIHAGGHVVRNLPKYVTRSSREYELTDWANENVDKCCLRFTRQYVQNRVGHFVLGRLYYDAEYVQRNIEFLSPIMKKHKIDEISAKMKYKLEFMNGDLVEEFDRIMHFNGDSRETVSEKLNISDKTLKRALDDPINKMPLDMVVALCLIWRLPDWLSMMLLHKTYNPLQDFDRRHQAIDYIQRAMWDKGIDEANKYLRSLHLNELAFPKN